MTPETLSATAGALLALALAYVPGLAPKFAALSSVTKRLVVAVCLLAVAAASLALSCYAPFAALVPGLACSTTGAGDMIAAFIAALVANQGTYLLAVRQEP